MYASTAVRAGDMKGKTTQKNAKREPECNKRINKTVERYGKDLAI